jgi:hypothetical protein
MFEWLCSAKLVVTDKMRQFIGVAFSILARSRCNSDFSGGSVSLPRHPLALMPILVNRGHVQRCMQAVRSAR